MKKILIYILLLFSVYGESSIYVGDPINLKIGATMVEKELKDVFKDFYIENIEDFKDYYNITVRAKKPGNYILNVDNTQLTIKVMPTSTSGEAFKENFTNKVNIKPKSIIFPYYLILVPIIIFFLIKSGIHFKRNKVVVIDIDKEFQESIKNLSDETFLFDISYALRRYIDKKSGTKLLYGEFEENHIDIKEFLNRVEELKYSKKEYEKEKIRKEVLNIYQKIRGGTNA